MTNDLAILRAALSKAHIDFTPETAYVYTSSAMTQTEEVLVGKDYYKVIFSHEFARGLWGDEWRMYYNGRWEHCTYAEASRSRTTFVLMDWQHHLQQLVLQEKPLLYIAQFIEEK